jgi:hypothetical protein
MKCRYCDKSICNTKDSQKRFGLCTKCYNFDEKWVKEGIKYSKAKQKSPSHTWLGDFFNNIPYC